MRTRKSLLTLATLMASLALPAGALAQSAGDEQYTDPFGQEDVPAQQEPTEPAAPPTDNSEPAPTGSAEPAPTGSAEPAPTGSAEPAPGGDGSTQPASPAEAVQSTSPTLPRTGVPVGMLAALGYALLLAGIVIRRQA